MGLVYDFGTYTPTASTLADLKITSSNTKPILVLGKTKSNTAVFLNITQLLDTIQSTDLTSELIDKLKSANPNWNTSESSKLMTARASVVCLSDGIPGPTGDQGEPGPDYKLDFEGIKRLFRLKGLNITGNINDGYEFTILTSVEPEKSLEFNRVEANKFYETSYQLIQNT